MPSSELNLAALVNVWRILAAYRVVASMYICEIDSSRKRTWSQFMRRCHRNNIERANVFSDKPSLNCLFHLEDVSLQGATPRAVDPGP